MRRWMNVLRTPLGLAATVLTVGVLVLAVLAPILWTDEADAVDTSNILAGPSADHWAGTDNLGRDIFYRTLVATRLSVELRPARDRPRPRRRAAARLGALPPRSPVGPAGHRGRSTSRWPSRASCSRCSSRSSSGSAPPERCSRSASPAPRCSLGSPRPWSAGVAARDFVSAARVAGLGRVRILFRHILPNVAEPLVVNATIGAGSALLSFAGLSFLGLGVQSPDLRLGPAPLRRRRLDLRQPGCRARPRRRRAARRPRVQPVRRDRGQGLRGAAGRGHPPARGGDERLARDRGPAGGDPPRRVRRRSRRPRPRGHLPRSRTVRSARCGASASPSAGERRSAWWGSRGRASRSPRSPSRGSSTTPAASTPPGSSCSAPTCGRRTRRCSGGCSAPRWRWSSRTR